MKTKIFIIFILIFVIKNNFSQSGWVIQNSNVNQNLQSVQFLDANTGYACGNGSTILKTTNGGLNWVVSLYGSTNYSLAFYNTNTGYIVGFNGNGGLVIKTTNGGLNWNVQNSNTIYALYSINIIQQTNGLAAACCGSYGSMIKTTNGGNNWFLLTSGSIDILRTIYFSDLNTGICCGGFDYPIDIKTTDGGFTWFNLNIPVTPYTDILSFSFVNSNTGYFLNSNPRCVYKTTNTGNNWITPPSIVNSNSENIFFPSIDTGYIIGELGYIAKTTNASTSWITLNSGTIHYLRCVYFINANTGWAVGDTGIILKTTNGGEPIGIKPISNNVPEKFELYQNYPNPFNPSTKIKFDLPSTPLLSKEGTQGVVLKIYDLLGSEVSTLLNEKLQPGTYEVNWNAYNFSSGVYFYKLAAGDFVETRRMVLLK